ncbi:MAG: sporulation integral membrane protein YtvI [Eubacteriales bacterium]
MDQESYERHKRVVFYGAIALILTVFFYYLFFRLLLPGFAAWLVALLLQPMIGSLSRWTGLGRKPVAVILYLLILGLIAVLLVILCNRLYREVRELLSYLSGNGDSLTFRVREMVDSLLKRFNFIENADEIGTVITDLMSTAVSSLSAKLTAFLGGFVSKLPGTLFSTLIFLMAAFYLTVDFEGFERKINGLIPKKAARIVGNLRGKLSKTVVGYIRAYLIILSITFVELLISFSILKIRYTLLLSALISLLDILPAIGVGTVLVPWAGICFLSGNPGRGIGLLIVFGIVAVLRQIMEPHIVGSQLGLSPLLSLLSVYAGYRLAGVVGILLAPIGAILIREIYLLYGKGNSERPAATGR